MRSMVMNPALCGVQKYSGPGLPKPTTRNGPDGGLGLDGAGEKLASSAKAYFFAPDSGFLPASGSASPLPFLATSGSAPVPAVAPATASAAASGVATTSSRIVTTCATVVSSASRYLILSECGR